MSGLFFKIILFLILLVIISSIPVNTSFSPAKDGIPIFISSNGVHTDFVLPIKTEVLDWQRIFESEHFGIGWSYAPYIAFGWGDRGFYLNTPEWSDLEIGTAINALFIPSTSAMHVSLWPQPDEDDLTKKITISNKDYEEIVEYILNSFAKGEDGNVSKIDHPGYGDYDLFFESSLKFHLFKTCNVWTNKGLKTAGIRTSLWTPFDKPILYHIPD